MVGVDGGINRRRSGWWLLALALVVCPLAAAPRKVVVYVVGQPSLGAERVGDAVAARLVEVLGGQPETLATTVHPTPEIAAELAWLSAGETATRIGQAASARLVLLVSVGRAGDGLLAGGCGCDKESGVLTPLEPARAAAGGDGVTSLATALAQQAVAWLQALARPHAVVVDSQTAAGGVELRVKLDGRPALGEAAYDVELLGAPLASPRTGEKFEADGQPLGRAQVVRPAAGTVGLQLPTAPGATAGAPLRLWPVGGAPTAAGRTLVVTTRPWGALVTVGGQVQGASPLRLRPAAGEVEVGALHPLALPWKHALTAAEREAGLLAASLGAPETPGAPGEVAGLRVDSEPSGSEVLVNGQSRGVTPLRLADVTGPVSVTVQRPGYRPWQTALVVTGSLHLRAMLVALDGVIQVVTATPGAKVVLDGRALGLTPLELTGVPVGEHEVTVVPATGQQWRKLLVIQAGSVHRLELGEGRSGLVVRPQLPPREWAPLPSAPMLVVGARSPRTAALPGRLPHVDLPERQAAVAGWLASERPQTRLAVHGSARLVAAGGARPHVGLPSPWSLALPGTGRVALGPQPLGSLGTPTALPVLAGPRTSLPRGPLPVALPAPQALAGAPRYPASVEPGEALLGSRAWTLAATHLALPTRGPRPLTGARPARTRDTLLAALPTPVGASQVSPPGLSLLPPRTRLAALPVPLPAPAPSEALPAGPLFVVNPPETNDRPFLAVPDVWPQVERGRALATVYRYSERFGERLLELAVTQRADGRYAVDACLHGAGQAVLSPAVDGLAIDWRGVAPGGGSWWPVSNVPGLYGVGIEPGNAAGDTLRLHLRLGKGFVASFEAAESADRVRFVLEAPGR